VEEGLLSADPPTLGFKAQEGSDASTPYAHAKKEIEEGVHQLETLLEAAVDRNFDRLELYVLQNILTLPPDLVPWVRLGHYQVRCCRLEPEAERATDIETSQDIALPPPQPDPNAPTPTPETLQTTRRQLLETRKLRGALTAEKTRNATLLAHLRSALSPAPGAASNANNTSTTTHPTATDHDGPLAFLHADPSAAALGLHSPLATARTTTTATASTAPPGGAGGPGPLTTQTTFTLAQLPSLRALLAELRPALGQLPAAPTGDGAAERRAYVERLARRAVERRGGDVDAGGVVDGRRVAVEEVQGVEGFVAGLGAKEGD
jgi:kinetochore protein Mis12/MTW1